MFDLNKIIRKNIKQLTPYSSARDDFKGAADVFLDANENSIGSALTSHNLNRYPDPLQKKVKGKIGKIKGVAPQCIFLANGSDEAIDILIRAFCNPGKDSIMVFPPTYGMYEVAARINDIGVKKVNLAPNFGLDMKKIIAALDNKTKLIFACSPNNPTGTVLSKSEIEALLKKFSGIVVVDEAYIDFADTPSTLSLLSKHRNLVVLQTFSKAWGMAGLRVGMAFANAEIISVMNKIKAPYNVGELSQQLTLQALNNGAKVRAMIKSIKDERSVLRKKLSAYPFVNDILPSEGNFLLVKTTCPGKLYDFLVKEKVVVRDRSGLPLCEGGLRITVGTAHENRKLISLFNEFQKKNYK